MLYNNDWVCFFFFLEEKTPVLLLIETFRCWSSLWYDYFDYWATSDEAIKLLTHLHVQKLWICFQLRLVFICDIFQYKLQSLWSICCCFSLLYRIFAILAEEFFNRWKEKSIELRLFIHSYRIERYFSMSICLSKCMRSNLYVYVCC